MTETREASLAALRNREKTSALKTEQKERWVSNQSDEIEGQRELSACHN